MPTLTETKKKIISFAYLPVGWNFGKGVPAKETALEKALILLDALEDSNFTATDAYPGTDGSVLLTAYTLPDYYDFDIKPSGLITVTHARKDEDDELFYQEGMLIENVQKKIKEFAVPKWHTSDCSTFTIISAKNSNNLRATPFGNPGMVRVFPSFILNVQLGNQGVFVFTVESSTPKQPELRSSSGSFPLKSLQTVGA